MKVICTKTKATVEKDELPVEGRVGLVCTFEFSPEWSGLTKSATFVGKEGVTVPVIEDRAVVPPEVFAAAARCRFRVGVVGRAADGTAVIPTIWADAGIINSSPMDSDYPDVSWEPTPSYGAQIQQIAESALNSTAAAQEAAENAATAAATASASAENARATVTEASALAAGAAEAAQAAATSATNAEQSAADADGRASAAQNSATAAQTSAGLAATAAETAKNDAARSKELAEAAALISQNAVNTAYEARVTANNAMDEADTVYRAYVSGELKGKDGERGPTGPQGVPGPAGSPGRDGHTPTEDELKAVFAPELGKLNEDLTSLSEEIATLDRTVGADPADEEHGEILVKLLEEEAKLWAEISPTLINLPSEEYGALIAARLKEGNMWLEKILLNMG